MLTTVHISVKENVKEKNNFLGILLMSKPGKVLKALCKRLKVRLTVKRGRKRVYKSIKVLKRQCANKKKKRKKVKRKRRFGPIPTLPNRIVDSKGTYIGQIKDDKKHGNGILTNVNGDKYVGKWKDNKRHGTGTYTWADGNNYVGEWKDGKRHGTGTYTWADGTKYVGEYKDNKKHGTGTYTWADGTKYVGEYKDNKSHGTGTYTWADGTKHVGEWKDGKKHGEGEYIYIEKEDEKSYLKGVWDNDVFISGNIYSYVESPGNIYFKYIRTVGGDDVEVKEFRFPRYLMEDYKFENHALKAFNDAVNRRGTEFGKRKRKRKKK